MFECNLSHFKKVFSENVEEMFKLTLHDIIIKEDQRNFLNTKFINQTISETNKLNSVKKKFLYYFLYILSKIHGNYRINNYTCAVGDLF